MEGFSGHVGGGGGLLMRSPTMSRIIWLIAKANDLSRPSPCKHSTESKLVNRYSLVIGMGQVKKSRNT